LKIKAPAYATSEPTGLQWLHKLQCASKTSVEGEVFVFWSAHSGASKLEFRLWAMQSL